MVKRRVRRGWVIGAALLLAMCVAIPASAYVPWPGLPEAAHPGNWVGAQTNGIAEVARAQQWVSIPAQAVAASDASLQSIDYPADDPQHRQFTQPGVAEISLVSPRGSLHGFGDGMDSEVRTVAFGSLPVQASVHLEQVRKADDLPVPLRLATSETDYAVPQEVRPGLFGTQHNDPSSLTGSVEVVVDALSVDGVPVELSGSCHTGAIAIDFTTPGYCANDPEMSPQAQTPPLPDGPTSTAQWMAEHGLFSIRDGGVLKGTVDIPDFVGCRTSSGDNVAPVLTAAISGPGNQITIGSGSLSGLPCFSYEPGTKLKVPPGPNEGDPSDVCDPAEGPPKLTLPAQPAR